MKKMSMIKIELLDQYIKCMNAINVYSIRIQKECVKGYISTKKINGHTYYYLQWQENNKIQSKYIDTKHINIIETNIKMRKKYENYISEIKLSMKDIEKFVGKASINEYLKNNLPEYSK